MTDPEDDREITEEDLVAWVRSLPILARTRLLLDWMEDDIPAPGPSDDLTTRLMSTFAKRAKSLYANFLHSLQSPAELGPLLAVRPLGELMILTKWVSLDPALHGYLHLADSDAATLVHLNAVKSHAETRGSAPPEDDPANPQDVMKATRDQALAALKAMGKNYGKDRIKPNLRRMSDEVIARVPGHKIAINDAYVYAYQTFSPWEHTDASSFRATTEGGPTDWRWAGDKSPWDPAIIEVIGSAFYAYILETAFATLGNEKAANNARGIRDQLMDQYGHPPAMKPEDSGDQRDEA